MSKYTIKDIESIEVDTETGELHINWWTGGREGAVNGLVLKCEFVKEKISDYKSPRIDIIQNHDRAF